VMEGHRRVWVVGTSQVPNGSGVDTALRATV
jgi:hypothetical protein